MRFTQPVSMKVDEEQFYYLKGELEKRGYKLINYNGLKDGYSYIGTNLAGADIIFSDFTDECIHNNNRHYIDHYNPELFLALASMTDEKYGIAGEWWVCQRSEGDVYFAVGELYKAIKPICELYAFIDNKGNENGFASSNMYNLRKATKQEIINHFNHLAKENMSNNSQSTNSNQSGNNPKAYQVKQSDLIRQIARFPIEVVQKMVERQVDQHGKADIKIFQECNHFGFTWCESIEGVDFWNKVINDKDFNLFFSKYPKNNPEPQFTHKVTRSQMAEIHSIACVGWKEKIERIVSEKFAVLADEAELPNKEVKAMFDAATDSQLPVLKRVFPNYGKMVIEKDALVMCACSRYDWSARYYSHENECFCWGKKSKEASGSTSWRYIVPVSDFDFNDLSSNVSKSIV